MDEILDEQELQEKTLVEKLAETLVFRTPKAEARYTLGRAGVELMSNGAFFYLLDGNRIEHAHSKASCTDGRVINTRTAKCRSTDAQDVSDELGDGKRIRSIFEENGLQLQRDIILRSSGEITVQIFLRDKKKQTVSTRYLAPVDAPYPDASGKALFLSLDQKMLLVPYDNDMWVRYESAVPRPGRTSYDVTAIYDENTLEGLILGALDFTVWKNAIACSAHDARAFTAFSGVADECTHDVMPHGIVSGQCVASARFVMFWSENIKRGMEHFGRLCTKVRPPRLWQGKSIFGWNSYSALGMGLKLSHWEQAGDFIRQELPEFRDEDGVTYINLDGCFGMSRKEIRRIVAKLHANGQKAGWYCAPCNALSFMAKLPLFSTLLLRDAQGNPLPPADNSLPLDVTHPQWEKYARKQVRSILDLGFDYIKFDFLSHGAVEGVHYRKEFTGRMALNHAYTILEDELSKAGREIFVSLSIAPLFPYFLGNARRCCCDSFGHMDDVRYVLNAVNFGWWTNGTLYRYNDPDHLALYHSVIDGRNVTTEAEARSRYHSGIISGTLMILSDNYGPEGDSTRTEAARARTKAITGNPKLNALARIGKTFVPAELQDGTTPFYTLSHEGRFYLAAFNFAAEFHVLKLQAARGDLPISGRAINLHDDSEIFYNAELSVPLQAYDSAIFEIIPD